MFCVEHPVIVCRKLLFTSVEVCLALVGLLQLGFRKWGEQASLSRSALRAKAGFSPLRRLTAVGLHTWPFRCAEVRSRSRRFPARVCHECITILHNVVIY